MRPNNRENQAKGQVSIHASVKDATSNRHSLRGYVNSFNPRICKRCDSEHIHTKDVDIRFNPRICKRCDSMFVKSFIDDTFKL